MAGTGPLGAAALVVGALLRILFLLLLARDVPVIGDSNGYLYVARHVRQTLSYTDIVFAPDRDPPGREGVRPPLYPWALAAGLDAREQPADPFPGAYLLQIAFDLGTLVLAMDLARRRFGRAAALATGWIYALLPAAVLYPSCVLLSEPVAGFTTALSLWCLQRLHDSADGPAGPRLCRAALAGLLLGLGMLTKESSQLLLLAALGALLLARWAPLCRRAAATSVVALTAGAVLAPWCLYTQRAYGTVLPSGTYGQLSMVYENWPPGETFVELWLEPPTYGEKIARASDAFRRSLGDHTGLFLRRVGWRLRVLGGPEVILPMYVSMARDGYRPDTSDTMAGLFAGGWHLQGRWGRSVQLACTLGALLFFALAAAGLAARADGLVSGTVLLFLLGFLATIALIVGQDRYRFALLSAFAPFAGLAAAALGGAVPLSPAQRRRALLAGTAVAVLLATTMLVLAAPAKPEG